MLKGLTVAEAIQRLQELPQHALIAYHIDGDVHTVDGINGMFSYRYIRKAFHGGEGYSSCDRKDLDGLSTGENRTVQQIVVLE